MLKVLIVGAGNMGALYDIGNVNTLAPRSHLSGFQSNSIFKIVGIVDPDQNKLELIRIKSGFSDLYKSISEVPEKSYDVVVIATSTKIRLEVIEQIINRTKLIFCEKPLAATLPEALKLAKMSKNIPFFLNYSRRWNSAIKNTFERVKSGEFGKLQSIRTLYTKGYINNGSHQIDLLKFLGCTPTKARRIGDFIDDGFSEPTFSFELELMDHDKSKVRSVHTAVHFKHFTVFEMDILLSKGRIKITDSGDSISIEIPKPDEFYVDYSFLHLKESTSRSQAAVLRNAINQVAATLENPETIPNCGLADGLSVLAVCDALGKCIDQGDTWINVESYDEF